MRLYYDSGACRLADHITLHHAGLSFGQEQADLRAKTTESGPDFTAINPKGYVLALDAGRWTLDARR
jgi:glutathione S-transferase